MLQLIRYKPKLINKFTIYGERHSGTNFLESLLNDRLAIPRTWNYGDKHWFGFTTSEKLISASETLFICIVRNPYDWINGFYLNPYHVPSKNTTSFKNFLLNEWYSINPVGEEIVYDRNFMSHERYQNIFELRKYKLYYLCHILPNIVDNYVFIRYEDLLIKSSYILDTIINYFNLKPNLFSNYIGTQIKHPYKTHYELLEIMNSKIDWTIEKMCGYTMESVSDRGYVP